MSDLDNEQNPINWLVGQTADATEIGGEMYTPKQTLSEMITTMLASANKDVPEARQVLKKTAMDVVERSLYKTIGVSDVHQRVFTAERELADYLNMAINGHQPVVAGGHTDLLPIGHPLSTNPAEVSLRTRALSESEWVSADPRISEEFRPLVASIYLTSPGSVEHNFLVARLESADIKDVPKDVVLAVTAAGNPFGGGNSFLERSARAKLQRRDRLGRFAFMGGGARAFVRLANGFIQSVVGRFVGVGTDSDTFDVEFVGDPVLGTGIYRMKTQNVAGVKAFIRNLRGMLKNTKPKSATYASGYAVDFKDLQKIDAPNGWSVDATPSDPEDKSTKKFKAPDGYGVRQYNNTNDIPSYEENSSNKDVEVKGLGKKGEIDPKYPVYELYTDPLNAEDKDKFDSDEPTLIGYYQSWGDLQSSTQRFDKKTYQKVDARAERKMWGDAPDGDHPQGVFEQVNPSDDKTPFSTYRSRNNVNGNGGYTVRRFQPEKHGDAKADMDREVADGAEVRGFKSGSSEIEPDQPIFEVTRQPAPWERNTEPDVIGYAQDWEDVQAMAEASELAMPRGENPRRKAIKKFKKETGLEYVDEKDVILPSDFEEYENGRLYYIPKDVNADRARITRDYRGQYVAEFYDNAEDQKNLKPSRTITSRTKEEALLDAAEHLTEEKSIKSVATPEEKERSEAEMLSQPKPSTPEVKKPSQEIYPIPDVSNVIGADGKQIDPALLEWYADENGIRIPDANLKDSDKTPENRRIRDLDNDRVLDGNGREVEFDPKYSPDADPRPDVRPDHEDAFWDANEVNESEVQKGITDPQLAYEALFDGGFIEVSREVAIEATIIAMEDRDFIGPDDNSIGRSRLARALSSALQGLPNAQANRLRRAINPAALNKERAQELLDFINSKRGEALTTDEMKMLHRKYRNMGVDITNMKMEGSSNYLNNNLGAERGKMPQLSTPEDQANFEAALSRLGIKFEAKVMTPDQLTPVQAEMDMGNVGKIMLSWLNPALRKKFGMDEQVLYVTRDGYVIDGHHRWASALLAQIKSGKPIELKCVVVDLDHEDALRICNEYNDHIGVTRQTLGATSADAKATPKRDVEGEVGRKGNPPKDSSPPVSTPLAEPPEELPGRQPVATLPEGAPAPQSPPLPRLTDVLPEPKKTTKKIPTPISPRAFADRKGTDPGKSREYGTGFVLTTPDLSGGVGIVPTPEKLEEYEKWLDSHKDADNEVKKRISAAMVEKWGPNWAEKFIELSSTINRKNQIYGKLRDFMSELWEKNLGGAGEIKMKIASDIRRAVQSGEIKTPGNDAAMREHHTQRMIDEAINQYFHKNWNTLANAVSVIRANYPDSEQSLLIDEGYKIKDILEKTTEQEKSLVAIEAEMDADLSKFAQREYRRFLEESGVEMYNGDGSEIFEVSGTLRKYGEPNIFGKQKEETKKQEEDEETLRKVEVAFRSALSRYPKWMVDRLERIIAKSPSGKLQVSINYTDDPNYQKRGFFQIIDGNFYIQISKNNNSDRGLLDFEETAAHEIGHAMEAAIPEIRALEWLTLTSRTRRFAGGEARETDKFESVVPGNPSSTEIGVLDNFRNTYASRLYGPLHPEAYYEVFTMTQERMQGGGTHRVNNPNILDDVKSGKITAEEAIFDTDTTMALGVMLDGGDSELALADEQVRKGAVLEAYGWSKKGSPELVDVGFVDETQNLSDQASTKRSKKSQEILSRIADVGDKRAIVNEDYGGYVDVYQKGRYDAPDGKTYTMYFRESQVPNGDGTFTISGGVDITDGTDDVGDISYSEVRKVIDYKGSVVWDETTLPLWYSRELYDITKPFSTINYVEVAPEARRKGIATALLEFARRHSATPIHHSQELLEDGKNFAKAVQSSDVLTEDLPVFEGDTSVSSPDLYGAQSEKAKQIESRIVPSGQEPVVKTTKLPSFINNEDHTMVETTTDFNYTTESGEKFTLRRKVEEVKNDSTGEVTQLRGTVYALPEGQEIPEDIDDDTQFDAWIDYVGGKKDISTVAEEYQSTVDASKPFATIYGIATKPENQRKGLATALLLVARKDSAMPVYHSSLRTMDGFRFSKAIQNTNDVVDEDLPAEVIKDPRSDIGGKFSSDSFKAKEVRSRIKIDKDKTEVTEITPTYKESKAEGTYELYDGRQVKLVFDEQIERLPFNNGEVVEGDVEALDEFGNRVGHVIYSTAEMFSDGTYDLEEVANELHPDADGTKPFTVIGIISVDDDYQRNGVASAILEFARIHTLQPLYHSSNRSTDGRRFSKKIGSPSIVEEELPDVKETAKTREIASRVKINDDLEERTNTERTDGGKEYGLNRTAQYTDENGVVYYLELSLGEVLDKNGKILNNYRSGSIRAYTKEKNKEYVEDAGHLTWTVARDEGDVAVEARPLIDANEVYSYITKARVYQPYQRKGLATAMLQFARSQDKQPIFHSSNRTTDGFNWSTNVQSSETSTDELPNRFDSGDPKKLTATDVNYLIESSPVTKNTLTYQRGGRGVGSLAKNGYKENSLDGYKPNFDADGDVVHEKIYNRAITSGLSDKDAEKLATEQTTEIRNFIQRKNDKSRMAYLVEKAITPPEGASEKVVKERTRWAKIWDRNTTTVKERVSKALSTGRVVEPVSKESFMDIVKDNGKFDGVGFIADDFSTGKSESKSADSISQKMRNILSVKNKKHDSKIKVVFKNSVRKNTEYIVGDSLNSASISRPLDSIDEDSMVMAGLMGNANGAFISMSGMGAPKDDNNQVETFTTGDLGLTDVESVYVSGEEDAREIRQALDDNFPNIEVVNLDGSESDRRDVGLNFLTANNGQIQNSVAEIQEELPKQDPDSPERQMSEKAKFVRKTLSVDTVPEIVATEEMSFGDKREYLEGRGSYVTPNGDIIDLVFEEKRNYNREGQKETDTGTITAFDDNYNLVGLLEVNMVEFDTDESGRERYSLKDIDEVSHPEILGRRDSLTPLAEISWIKVEDDYQRQGIGTALLEFGRDVFPMPIYHSNNLSPEGRKYSKAVQTSENVEEELPVIEEKPSDIKPIPPLVDDEAPKPEATADASSNARIVRERALEIEPQITKDVSAVAKSSRGVLKSLENRIKTTKSLARKIDKDAIDDFGGDRAEAALRVSDAVRYTMVTSTEDYVTAIKQARAEFLELGYQVQNEKNSWKSEEYKGYTFKLISPDGYAVEFQIHTDESYEIKDDLHKLYEELREIPAGTNVPKARQLKVELARLAKLIPVPDDEELFELGRLVQFEPDKKLTRLGEEFKDILDQPKSQAPQTSDTLTEELPTQDTSGVDVDLWGDPILPPVEGSFYDDDGNYKYGPRGEKSKAIFKRIVPTNEYMDQDGSMVYTADFTDEEGTEFNLINIIDPYSNKGVVQVYSTNAYPQLVGEIIYSEAPISNDEDGLLTWDRDQLPPWYPEENYDIYNPFATIDLARVSPAQQRRGLATAMLEFARSTNNMPIHHSYNLSSMGLQFAQAIQNAPTLDIEDADLPDLSAGESKAEETKSVIDRITYGPKYEDFDTSQQSATYTAEDGTVFKLEFDTYARPNEDESGVKTILGQVQSMVDGSYAGQLSWESADYYIEEDGEVVWQPVSELSEVAEETEDIDTSKSFSIIRGLAVSEDQRRKGLATAMLHFARQASSEPIYHSQDRTDDGKAFSRAVQSPVLLEDMDELPVRDEVPFRDMRMNRRPDRRAIRRARRKGLDTKEKAKNKKRNTLVDSPNTVGNEAKFTPGSVVSNYAQELRRANLERVNFSERVTRALDSLEEDGITKKDIAESIYNSDSLSPWDGKIDMSDVLVLDSVTGRTLTGYEYSNRLEVSKKTEMLENKLGKKRKVTFEQAKEILKEHGGYGSGNRRYVLLADTEVSVPTVARRHLEKTFRELDKNLTPKSETSQLVEEELPTYNYEPVSSKSREVAERIVEDPSKFQTWPDVEKVLDNVDNNVGYWLRLYLGSDSFLDFDETFTLEDYKRLDEYRLNPPVTKITVSEREHVATYKAVGGGDTYKLTMTVKEIKDSKTGKVLAVSGRGEADSRKDDPIGGEFLFASPNINGIDEQGNFLYDARFIASETRENLTRDDLKKPFGFVTGVYVDEDVQRQGIATALLEFARQKAGVPIYHSSNRSDEGYAFSTAVKSPQLVEEDLPPQANEQSADKQASSDKTKEVMARVSTNSPRTEVRKDKDGNPIYQTKGTYKTPSGEVLDLVLEDTESIGKEDGIRYVNGSVEVFDSNSRSFGRLNFGIPYDYTNYPDELPYEVNAVDREIHPEVDPDSPFAIIDSIRVFPQRQREGIATAMLGFARENFNLPIYHSTDKTARGIAFATSVQSPTSTEEELPTLDFLEPNMSEDGKYGTETIRNISEFKEGFELDNKDRLPTMVNSLKEAGYTEKDIVVTLGWVDEKDLEPWTGTNYLTKIKYVDTNGYQNDLYSLVGGYAGAPKAIEKLRGVKVRYDDALTVTYEEAKQLFNDYKRDDRHVLLADSSNNDSASRVAELAVSQMFKDWNGSSISEPSQRVQAGVKSIFNLQNTYDIFPPTSMYGGPQTVLKDLDLTDPKQKLERDIVKAQYDYTQKKLKEFGIKRVFVWRGTQLENAESLTTPTKMNVDSRPLSSWTARNDVSRYFANMFGDKNAIIRKEVPVEEIFSITKTGMGMDRNDLGFNESEVVLLGGRSEVEAMQSKELFKVDRGMIFSPQLVDEELPAPTVASSIVSERDSNIQELLDTKAIASIEDATKVKEYGAGVSDLDINATISLGLGQSPERSDKFMQRLWELNLKYLQKSLGTIDWKVEQQTIDKMRAMGLSDRASKRAAEGALLAAKAYAKVKNFSEAMNKIAKTMAEEFPEDRWFGQYYKRALVTREVAKEKLKTAVPVISADFDSALGIILDKRFKTQWETGSSNGLYQPSTREKREFGLLAVDPKTPKGKRPIYGFLATDDDGATPMSKPHNMDLFAVNNRAISQYGDVRFVLKPETRERTTFTMQDSLDVIALPQPLSDNPTDEQIDMAGFWQNVTDSHDGFFREPYIEAQVSGGVSMDDVERIVVSVPYYTDYPEAQAKFLKRKVDTLRAELDAAGYENIQITTVTETPSESYQDEAMNISGIPL